MALERDERPWGMYEVLAEDGEYKVKRIEVKPGQRLSLQLHDQRSEHWVVVAGEALITIGETEKRLRVNDTAFIPVRTKHRVANLGPDPLVFIEVQCGTYLGEDDITRFEDDYNRIAPESDDSKRRA
jgi:mannose-6-phosphate isomerase